MTTEPTASETQRTVRCECWPDYSTPDAPSLDRNPDCPACPPEEAARLDDEEPF